MEISKKNVVLSAWLLVAVFMMSSCGLLPTEEEFDAAPIVKEYEGNNYNKYTVVRGNMTQKESIAATYQGTTRVEVVGQGLGEQIKKFCVKEGQKVELGDILLENYLPQQENIVKNSKREMNKLELQIRQAQEMKEQELHKLARLHGTKEQKKSIREQYDSQIQNCESSLELIKLDIKEAKEELEYSTLTAEIDGRVTKLDKSFEGGFASENDVLMVLEGKKKNRFRARTKYASSFKNGQQLSIMVSGRQYKVTVKKSWQKNLMYLYPKTQLSLKNGIVGTVELILKEKKDVLYLPAALVYDMGDKKIVYVEDENGVKTIREVTVGEQIDNQVEITGGLKENEQIITN